MTVFCSLWHVHKLNAFLWSYEEKQKETWPLRWPWWNLGGLGVKLAWSERGSVAREEGVECSTYEKYTVSFIPTILKTLWAKAAARRGRKAVARTPIHSLNLCIWSHGILLGLKFPRVKKWEHMSKLTPFNFPEKVALSGGSDSKESAKYKTWLNPWVRKLPWRRDWLSTPVFLPGEFHGEISLAGYKSMGSQRVEHNWVINTFTTFHFPWWLSGKESPANTGDYPRVRYDLVTEQKHILLGVSSLDFYSSDTKAPLITPAMWQGWGNFWTASCILLIHTHCRKCSWI